MRWLCTADMSKPADRNFAMTGFSSLSSRTKSPMTIALSSVPRNAAHEPSARPGLIARPCTETCKSLLGKLTLYTSPVFCPERPKTSSIAPVVTPCARTSMGNNKTHNTIKQRNLVLIISLLMNKQIKQSAGKFDLAERSSHFVFRIDHLKTLRCHAKNGPNLSSPAARDESHR